MLDLSCSVVSLAQFAPADLPACNTLLSYSSLSYDTLEGLLDSITIDLAGFKEAMASSQMVLQE